jgi:outer membrane receptor protein involved in Fe transport
VVNWDASFALVTSATSYAEQDIKLSADQSLAVRPFGFLFGVPGALARSDSDLGLTKFTQEIRIASPTSSNNPQWVVGAFFTDEKSKSGNDIGLYKPDFTLAPNLNPFLTTDLPTGYKEYAAFGDITVRIVETMSLSGGIRLAKNEQSWVQTSGGAFAGPSAGTLTAPSNNESIATWSAAARYQPTSKIMVYGRIATGYRPGGPNAPTPGAPLSVRSDNLINYELGIKSDLFEDRIRINATVFIVDWDDVQLNAVRGGFSYLGNGGKAKTEGLEFSASWLPVVGLTLTSNLAYTKSELTSVTTESNFVEGYQLPGVPKVTASFNADYAWVPAQGWDAAVGGNWRYVGEQWLTGVQRGASAAPAIRAPSYQMVNLYASVTRGDLSFKIFGNNITNKRAQQGGIALIDLGNNPVQGDIYISKPRTVGFGVDVKFN